MKTERIEYELPGRDTCASWHNHGDVYASLAWQSDRPWEVEVGVWLPEKPVDVLYFPVARQLLREAVLTALDTCRPVGRGAVRFAAHPMAPQYLRVSYARSGAFVVRMDQVIRFLDETYRIVSHDSEDGVRALSDDDLKRLLEVR